jgi:putative DNA primase/helicase
MNWKWETGADGRPTKPPYQGRNPRWHARNNDPKTWSDLDTCMKNYTSGKVDGIGFALLHTEIGAIDIDHCRNKETGTLYPWAADVANRAKSYCEVTPSLEGIRIIGRCTGTKVHRKLDVADGVSCELYRVAERYITITGNQIGQVGELGNIDKLIDDLLIELEAKKQAKQGDKTGADTSKPNGKGPKSKYDLDDLIKNGCGEHFNGDRSRAVWYVIHQLLERGDSVDDIVKVITDPNNSIAAHCLSKPGDYRAYARKQVEKAKREQAEDQQKRAEKKAATTEEDAELARLAKLSAFDYEHERKDAADELGVRASILDKLVTAKRAELHPDGADDLQGTAVTFPEIELWPDPVAGDQLLTDVADTIRKHVVLAEHERDLCALWVVHSYLLHAFLITPRLAIRSVVKRSGKTTTLDVLGRLVHRPLPAANASASAIFRVVESYRPTLLIDEADTFLRNSDELRGVLNAGHRRGGTVLRTVGDSFEPRSFSVYGACAIALIGQLPGTLADRAITINLKRRKKEEEITAFRIDRTEHLDTLARRIARWAQDNAETIRDADPEMPDGVFNREADNLRPLLAVAGAAGGEWPKRARNAATEGREAGEVDEGSRLELLLSDIRDIFRVSGHLDKIASATLIERLIDIDGHPWAEYGRGGKPITQTKLARLLKPLGIAPEQIRFTAEDSRKGYWLSHLNEAFERYLPPEDASNSQEGASQPKQRNKRDETGTSEHFQTETAEDNVSDAKCEKSNNNGQSFGVSDGKGDTRPSTLDSLALSTLGRRYVNAVYDADGRLIGDMAVADGDLRGILATLVPPDRIEVEFDRVMELVATGKV